MGSKCLGSKKTLGHFEINVRVGKKLSEPLSNFLIEQRTGGTVVEEKKRGKLVVVKAYSSNKKRAELLKKNILKYLKELKNTKVGKSSVIIKKLKKRTGKNSLEGISHPFLSRTKL